MHATYLSIQGILGVDLKGNSLTSRSHYRRQSYTGTSEISSISMEMPIGLFTPPYTFSLQGQAMLLDYKGITVWRVIGGKTNPEIINGPSI